MTGNDTIGGSTTCSLSPRSQQEVGLKRVPPKVQHSNLRVIRPENLLRSCAYVTTAPPVALASAALSVMSVCFGGGCFVAGIACCPEGSHGRRCVLELGVDACCSFPCEVVTRVNNGYYCCVFDSSNKEE